MINRKKTMTLGLAALACAGMTMFGLGCGSDEDQQVVAAPPPPPPPPPPAAPKFTPIEQLMTELNIDRRVVLPENKAPDNDPERKAVLVFFDAFARGNADAVKTMLPDSDKPQLATLVDSGQWKDTTSKITKIEIQTGENNLETKCALAVIEVGKGSGTSYQPQLWYFTAKDDQSLFESAPTPPNIMDRLTGDWIETWHKLLKEESDLALKPDEDVKIDQKNLDQGGATAMVQGEAAPSSPRGGGGLRNPTAPEKPPGIPSPGKH